MINVTAQEWKMQGTDTPLYSVVTTTTGADNSIIDAGTTTSATTATSIFRQHLHTVNVTLKTLEFC